MINPEMLELWQDSDINHTKYLIMKLYFDVISGDRKTQLFMEAVDMTDRGRKQFADIFKLELTTPEEVTVDQEFVDKTIKSILSLERSNVCFVGFRSISIHGVYFKHNIQSISNGEKWILFKEALTSIGYQCETDEHMQVTSVKFSADLKVHI